MKPPLSRYRKSLSYLMLPVMLVYTFCPGIAYAEEYNGKGKASSPAAQEYDFSSELARAKALNTANSKESQALEAKVADSTASPSSSQAVNYAAGIGAQVNVQTGQLDINFNNVQLSGVSSEVDVDFGLSNGAGADSIYNLPPGWKFNLDYVDNRNSKKQVLHLNSGMNYTIDSSSPTGLRYCKNKAIFLEDKSLSGNPLPYLPYNNSLQYRYILTSKTTGSHEYFDKYGKLICNDDRFGNHIIYAYESISGNGNNVFNIKLDTVTDSYGNEISVDYNDSVPSRNVTITMPDKRTVNYKFSDSLITVTDATGRQAKIILNGNNRINEIDFPTGGCVKYTYSANIPYSGGNFTGISDVKTYLDTNPDSSPVSHMSYNYTPNGQTSFAGPPNTYNPDGDTLMNLTSNYNSYFYSTAITTHASENNGGDIVSTQTFNFLHLPVKTSVSQKGTGSSATTNTTYLGNAAGAWTVYSQLPANYNLPKSVKNEIGGTLVSQTDSLFNSYGQPTNVTQYKIKDGAPAVTATKLVTYYGEDKFCQINTSIVTDNTDGIATTTNNDLSSDGKHIASSTVSRPGCVGKVTSTTLDLIGRPTSNTIALTECSNDNDNPTSSTITTEYTPSGKILTLKTTDPLGENTFKDIDTTNGWVQSETDALNNTIKYAYENNGLKVTKTYPDNSTVEIDNTDPNLTKTTYSNGLIKKSYLDGLGRVVKITDNLGDDGAERVLASMTYNELGKVATQTDMYGHTTAYEYKDYQGRLTSSKDYLGNIQSITYDDVNKISETALNSVLISKSLYNENGQTLQTISYLSGQGDSTPVTVSTYNGIGDKITTALQMTAGQFSASSDTESSIVYTNSTYDIDGSSLKVNLTTKDGTIASSNIQRGLFGDPIRKSTTFSATSPHVELGTGNISSEIKDYDSAGHLVKLTNELEKTTSYTYDANGNPATMTDFAGTVFNYTYNPMGQLTSVSGGGITRSNEYYPGDDNSMSAGKLKSKTVTYADGSSDTISYSYDTKGNLSTVKMNGKTMSMTYDQYGRVISVTDYAGIKTSYEYGDASTQTGVAFDAITSVSNKYGSASYTYYTLTDGSLFGNGDTLKEADYSNGVKVSYTYYADSSSSGQLKAPQLKSIETENSDGILMNGSYFTYDEQDRIVTLSQSSETDPNNINCNNTKTFTYNDMGQLTDESIADAGGTPVSLLSYTYDIRGNVLSRTNKDNTGTVISSGSYAYNDLNQLISSTETSLSAAVNKSYDYDDNGNLKGIRTGNGVEALFTYNSLNQLTEYINISNGYDVKYDYNAKGLRKDKYSANNPDNKIMFYYSGQTITNESDSAGKMSSYLIAGGRVLRTVGSETQWLISNGKDVVAMTDDKGKTLTNVYQYTPYGKDVNLADISSNVQNLSFNIENNPFKYSGYYYDFESGMYYLGNRYYHPGLMNFISMDSYDLLNRYAYGNGNPVSYVDPDGHMAKWLNYTLAGVAIAGGIAGIAFSGGSSFAVGMSIAGGLLGIASGTTQIAANMTTQNTKAAATLNTISTWTGVAGVACDIAGGIAAFSAARSAAKADAEFATETNKSAIKQYDLNYDQTTATINKWNTAWKNERYLNPSESKINKAVKDFDARVASDQEWAETHPQTMSREERISTQRDIDAQNKTLAKFMEGKYGIEPRRPDETSAAFRARIKPIQKEAANDSAVGYLRSKLGNFKGASIRLTEEQIQSILEQASVKSLMHCLVFVL